MVKILKSGGNATVYAFAGWPGPDPNPSDNPALVRTPVEGISTPAKTVSKQKVVTKSIHKASVPTPTTHFLGTSKPKQKRLVAEKARS
jgi:hypothetical protein